MKTRSSLLTHSAACTPAEVFDVVVLGGGPAGVVCACELVQQGCRVVLIEAGGGTERIEGLSPRVVQLLQQRGLAPALQAVTERLPRQVYWGEWPGAGQAEASANGEHLVRRPYFDQLLREQAVARGVSLLQGRVRDYAAPLHQLASVRLADGRCIRAGFVLDARGRRGQSGRQQWRAPASVAVSAWLQGLEMTPGTRIQALEQGWLWQARAAADEAVWVQWVQDARALAADSSGPEAVLLAAVQAAGGGQVRLANRGAGRRPGWWCALRIFDCSCRILMV
ncbi:MAG: tryptophan 7-halogenase [Thiolinea sp.]